MKSELNELSETCLANSKRWFPHLHDPTITSDAERMKHLGLGLAEEAGEVAGIIKKATGYRPGQAAHSAPPDLPSELVDVLVYLLNIAANAQIDLDTALANKTAECERRWG